MTIFQSKYAIGQLATPYPGYAGAVIGKRYTYALASAPSVGDIIELAPIPPECRILDLILTATDMDTGGSPAIVFDIGVMSGEWMDESQSRTCGAEFFSGSTLAQAGGMARPTLRGAFEVAPSGVYRSIGIKITTAAATFAAGTFGLTALFATD